MAVSQVVEHHKERSAEQKLSAKGAQDGARILSLLGNERRLLILCHLMTHREMRVCDMVQAIGLSQSALSQHLNKLRQDGLVKFRREAQNSHYRIADPRVAKLITLVKKLYYEDE